MLCIANTTQNLSDYMPQIIGVLGTLLGTILGWLLRLVTDNMGKIHIFVDSFDERISNQNEYAYITKLFIYNNSYKQQCIRNARFSFINCIGKVLFESIPSEGECSFEIIRKKKEGKEKGSMVSISSFAQNELIFSDLIDGEYFSKLSSVRKVYLLYEDKKNHTKKKVIKPNFKLAGVERTKWERFL